MERKKKVLTEVRCANCNKKLCDAEYSILKIKCPRCKSMNILKK
ncbi:Com family DNA-binding transcriptional regulator [Wohlfahrtiimonas chitiniclastica]|nr:Com family DNA-binding transcriptional regulator [Wohlfahrtiimonas chitiniclastica]